MSNKFCSNCRYGSRYVDAAPCDSCIGDSNWGGLFNPNNVRPSRDEVFKEMTEALAQRSVCLRKKVAAMIVKDGRPISVGYNGPPSGFPHCTKDTCKGKNCDISIHAEMNAIAFAAKSGVSIEGSTMYCTMSPCINCAKVILNSGIVRVVYFEEYRLRGGIELLERGGVKVEKLYREYFSKD